MIAEIPTGILRSNSVIFAALDYRALCGGESTKSFSGELAEWSKAAVLKAVARLYKWLIFIVVRLESPQLAEIVSATQRKVYGSVSERFKELVLKTSEGVTLP